MERKPEGGNRIDLGEVVKGDTLYVWNFYKENLKLGRKISWKVGGIITNNNDFVPHGKVTQYEIISTSNWTKFTKINFIAPKIPLTCKGDEYYSWETSNCLNLVTTFDDEKKARDVLGI